MLLSWITKEITTLTNNDDTATDTDVCFRQTDHFLDHFLSKNAENQSGKESEEMTNSSMCSVCPQR